MAMLAAMPNLQRERAGFTERLGHYLAQPAPKKAFVIQVGKRTAQAAAPAAGRPDRGRRQGHGEGSPAGPALHRADGPDGSAALGAGRHPGAGPALRDCDDRGSGPKNLRSQPKAVNKITYHYYPLQPRRQDHRGPGGRRHFPAGADRQAPGLAGRLRLSRGDCPTGVAYILLMARIDLTPFGFTPTESLVYQVLLTGGPGTGYAIARSAGLARANAYSALEGLVSKGAARLDAGRPRRYRPEPPPALLARISNSQGKRSSDSPESWKASRCRGRRPWSRSTPAARSSISCPATSPRHARVAAGPARAYPLHRAGASAAGRGRRPDDPLATGPVDLVRAGPGGDRRWGPAGRACPFC